MMGKSYQHKTKRSRRKMQKLSGNAVIVDFVSYRRMIISNRYSPERLGRTGWAFGTGTNRAEHYMILGIAIGICLLIAMPLGALIGWRAAVSLTKDFLLSKKLKWGYAVRYDW